MIRERVGYELAAIGERVGADWLAYNPVILRMYDRLATADARVVIAALRGAFPDARTALDVGAGSGAHAAEAQRQGLEVTALERSRHGRRLAARQGIDARHLDFAADPPTQPHPRVDVAYCFEVAEHLPAALAPRLVGFLHRQAQRVVLTAAPPGQEGLGHINEQPAEYWTALFRKVGREPRDPTPFVSQLRFEYLSPHWAMTSILVF